MRHLHLLPCVLCNTCACGMPRTRATHKPSAAPVSRLGRRAEGQADTSATTILLTVTLRWDLPRPAHDPMCRRDRSNYTTKYVNWRVVLKNTGVNAESLQVKRRRPQRCTETCQAGPVEKDGVVGSAALELSGSWATRGTATHSSRLRAQRRQKFSRLGLRRAASRSNI